VRSEGTDRRVILTEYGRVVLALRRLRCLSCRRRFRPAEACLKALQAGNVTAALSEACAQAGASWPYATAAQTLQRLCGAQISAEHLRRLTNRAGSPEALRQAEEAKVLLEPTAAQVRRQREIEGAGSATKKQQRPQMLWVGLDGGWIKSREHKKGMEGKVGVVVSEIEPLGKRGRRRMSRRRYVATFQNSPRDAQRVRSNRAIKRASGVYIDVYQYRGDCSVEHHRGAIKEWASVPL